MEIQKLLLPAGESSHIADLGRLDAHSLERGTVSNGERRGIQIKSQHKSNSAPAAIFQTNQRRALAHDAGPNDRFGRSIQHVQSDFLRQTATRCRGSKRSAQPRLKPRIFC